MCPKFELFKKKEIFYLINCNVAFSTPQEYVDLIDCDVAFSTPYTAASLEN